MLSLSLLSHREPSIGGVAFSELDGELSVHMGSLSLALALSRLDRVRGEVKDVVSGLLSRDSETCLNARRLGRRKRNRRGLNSSVDCIGAEDGEDGRANSEDDAGRMGLLEFVFDMRTLAHRAK